MRQLWPKAVLIVGGLLISALLATALLRPREPVYDGQSLSYWFERLQRPNPEAAWSAIREIGPQAVPFLLQKVRRENSAPQTWYRNTWAKLPSRVRHLLPTPKRRQMRFRVDAALHAIGPSSIPQLISAFADPNREVKLLAISVVRSMKQPSRETVRRLIPLLKDRDREVRGNAILALDRTAPYRQEAVPALIDALADDYSGGFGVTANVRELAAWTLGRMGPDAAAAAPRLMTLLTNTNSRMRDEAATALARVQRHTKWSEVVASEFGQGSDLEDWRRLIALFGGLPESVVDLAYEFESGSSSRWKMQPQKFTFSGLEPKRQEPVTTNLFDEPIGLIGR
jgi:HEAT repeat protein